MYRIIDDVLSEDDLVKIEQNDIKTVYKEYIDGKHFIVHGTNIS